MIENVFRWSVLTVIGIDAPWVGFLAGGAVGALAFALVATGTIYYVVFK